MIGKARVLLSGPPRCKFLQEEPLNTDNINEVMLYSLYVFTVIIVSQYSLSDIGFYNSYSISVHCNASKLACLGGVRIL